MSVEVDCVLVRPRRAGNVAAACRALKNMGFPSLWIVGREGEAPGQEEARALAYGAWDVLDNACRAEDLTAALHQATHVVGTTGRRDVQALSPRQVASLAAERALGSRIALVFGPEPSGLTNAELALCHSLVHIPTDATHSSLNLAQAVLILAYELRLALSGTVDPHPTATAQETTAGALEEALRELRDALLSIGYLNPQNPDHILRELRALLVRARPTGRELSLMRGLARQISWTAERRGEGDR
jgi:TrmH family RNA methyltransferase